MSCDRFGAIPPTYKAYKPIGGIIKMLDRSILSLYACIAIDKNRRKKHKEK